MSNPRRRRSYEEESDSSGEWLTTYSDLVTLLLTFFIMLYSMATIDKQKFIEVANSLRSSFLHTSSGEMFDYNRGKDIISIMESNNAIDEQELNENNDEYINRTKEDIPGETPEDLKARKLQNVKAQIQAEIKKLDLSDFVTIIEEKNYLTLRMDSIVLFELGSADIMQSGKEVLVKLGSLLKQLDNDILIQGHTDSLPINTTLFPTNWELSTKRATNVVLFLIEKCELDPVKLTATGNGEFKPIRPNDTEENRQKNRRIDIVIEK